MTKEQQYAAAMGRYSSGRRYEYLAVSVSAAIVSLQVASLVQVTWGDLTLPAIALSLLISYLVADFLNGLVHMVMDNADGYQTVVGPLIAAFHLHHKTPRYRASNPVSVYVMESGSKLWLVPYLAATVWAQPHLGLPAMVSLTLALVGILSSFAEVSHYLCHGSTGRLVRLLQRCRLLLPPEHHAVHHTQDNTHYAFLNGVSDPLLNAIARRTCQGYVNRTDKHSESYQGPDTGNRS